MAGQDEAWTRVDWARWFIHHDEVDEAARVLAPGDELDLGRSDFLNLVAALSRRGLEVDYQGRRARVQATQRSGASWMTGDIATSSRKPPVRGTPAQATAVQPDSARSVDKKIG